MANDPHRDLLPVRDCSRNGKGFTDKFDHQILGKLSRCELEDRFLRLLDEQTHIKKLANSQEEKIKRLGTKLLRLLNEKKSGKKFTEHSKETDDLHLRIIELEHENYRLKDKNTVLKQQLSTHTRQIRPHRSPVRSSHTSPEMTTRQSAPVAQSDLCRCASDTGNKNSAPDLQLQEAETHIKELNKEIKCLHNKIHFLEQNLEKNNLDNRKIKVSENIELIRLQRSLKQQAIQIASLQEQVKNSEKTQKLLKEELVKAHKENDEALHLISIKQGEILSLCGKLEEKNLNKLEEDELNERIRDLVLERDCLKERSDFLMKTIIAKAEECGKIKELQKLLEEEKCKKEKLEETLEHLKSNTKSCSSEIFENVNYEKTEIMCQEQQTSPEKTDMENGVYKTNEDSDTPRSRGSIYKCPSESSDTHWLRRENVLKDIIEGIVDGTRGKGRSQLLDGIKTETYRHTKTVEEKPNDITQLPISQESLKNPPGKLRLRKRRASDDKCEMEKMKLELELQYLREMLRSQTLRCEAQQGEITRLMYELKINENKCSETLQRLDWHLRIFESLEMRAIQNEIVSGKTQELIQAEKPGKLEDVERLEKQDRQDRCYNAKKEETKESRDKIESECSLSRGPHPVTSSLTQRAMSPSFSEGSWKRSTYDRNTYDKRNFYNPMDFSRAESLEEVPSKLVSKDTAILREVEPPREAAPEFQNRRFIDQTFLDSSEDELDDMPTNYGKDTFKKKYYNQESTYDSVRNARVDSKESSGYSLHKHVSSHSPSRIFDSRKRKPSNVIEDFRNVKISILWFKIKAGSSLWRNESVEMLFIDFTFLDINGEETETPESVAKPKTPDQKCEFNFTQTIVLSEINFRKLQKLVNEPDSILMVIKVVSDSEKYDETNEECEDVGGAEVTSKEFLKYCNKGPFQVPVKNSQNTSEVIGSIALSIEVPGRLMSGLK